MIIKKNDDNENVEVVKKTKKRDKSNSRDKSSKVDFKNPSLYLIGVLFILAAALVVQLFTINILPFKYTSLIVVLLILLPFLLYKMQCGKKQTKIKTNVGRFLTIILCIVLSIGNFSLYKGGRTIGNISGANTKTDIVSVIVMKENEAQSIDDLIGKSFGIVKNIDTENTQSAINDINAKTKTTIDPTVYSTGTNAAKGLYNEKIDAIILNDAYRNLFEESHPNFDEETKVVYQFEIVTKLEDISKNVDVKKDSFNIFISGIDTYGPVNTSSRSDVNILATVNPKTSEILLTNIPRDYYVAQPQQGNQLDKLTHAGIFGVDSSVETVEKLFGTDINYYARVNFTSLIKIVNALGGVTVNNPTAFSTGTHSFAAGNINLSGEKALAYSRDRYNQAGGDNGRGKNQMRVIEGMINKAISPAIISNYGNVMDAISGSFQTNMDSKEITSFIQKQLNDMSDWTTTQNYVVGTGTSDWSPANGFNSYVMVPDQSSVAAAKAEINRVLSAK